MRYAVLSFPRLPIQLLRRATPAMAGRAIALTQGEGDSALLSAISVEATADGVEPGMTSLQARQRCPGIELAAEHPARAIEALEGLVSIIRTRATPNVAIVSRNEIVVELDGFEGQFAGEGAAAMSLLGLVRSRSGLDVRCAVASSVREASCAARTARRFPVLCADTEAAGAPLPTFEPVGASFAWDAPAAAEAVDSRIGRLAGTLQTASEAYRQSYREVRLELEYGPYRRAFALKPADPIHTGAEALALIRGRVAVSELAGATSVTITLDRPGPEVRIEPWRSPVATIHQLAGPAVPVQRRLLRAS